MGLSGLTGVALREEVGLGMGPAGMLGFIVGQAGEASRSGDDCH